MKKVKCVIHRFNRDQKANIAHALMHLEGNKIGDDTYLDRSGWYCGNKEQFIKRHRKAIAFMRELIAPTTDLGR